MLSKFRLWVACSTFGLAVVASAAVVPWRSGRSLEDRLGDCLFHKQLSLDGCSVTWRVEGVADIRNGETATVSPIDHVVRLIAMDDGNLLRWDGFDANYGSPHPAVLWVKSGKWTAYMAGQKAEANPAQGFRFWPRAVYPFELPFVPSAAPEDLQEMLPLLCSDQKNVIDDQTDEKGRTEFLVASEYVAVTVAFSEDQDWLPVRVRMYANTVGAPLKIKGDDAIDFQSLKELKLIAETTTEWQRLEQEDTWVPKLVVVYDRNSSSGSELAIQYRFLDWNFDQNIDIDYMDTENYSPERHRQQFDHVAIRKRFDELAEKEAK